jgi:peptidoglycan/LPS O-acetylase OafA/YrhL
MTSSTQAIGYRPEIDGLRAIAVLAVVFYHAGLGCPGGYVGVDVFFVISGYLITSLILKDLRQGTFSLAAFWERRIRRIFPASAVCVLVTLIAGFFLLLPDDLENLGKSAIAQTLLVANFYFWRTTNYFGGANEEKPLLHTWSLAVEEQFYLFFPLLLLLLFRFPGFRRPGRLIGLMLAGAAISLALAMWGVTHQPFATFFLLPTRVWELLCGAIIAALPATAIPQSRWLREGGSWLGLAAILTPVWLYNEKTLFPGLAALPPCLGTAMLIWANGANAAGPPPAQTLPARILSLRAVVFIGLISYSLYLWHWPVIAFSDYWKTAPFSSLTRWSFVLASFGLAVLSWRFVETPFRKRRAFSKRKWVYSTALASSFLMLILGSAFVLYSGFPHRLDKTAQKILDELERDEGERKLFELAPNIKDLAVIEQDRIPLLGSKGSQRQISFVVLGDSHAQFAGAMFHELATAHDLRGAMITYQGTPPLIEWNHRYKLAAENPEKFFDASLNYIKRNQVKDVFLMAYWASYQKQAGPIELEQSLAKTIDAIREAGANPYLITGVPTYEDDISKMLLRQSFFGVPNERIGRQCHREHEARQSSIYSLMKRYPAGIFMDPSDQMLNKEFFPIEFEGTRLYMDSNHLTQFGVRRVWTPILEPIFRSMQDTRNGLSQSNSTKQ